MYLRKREHLSLDIIHNDPPYFSEENNIKANKI